MRCNVAMTIAALATLGPGRVAGQVRPVVFMEPVEGDSTNDLPAYRIVDEPERIALYSSWTANEPAAWALELYREAIAEARSRGWTEQPDALHIALVPDGNHAEVGFRLVAPGEPPLARPRTAYLKLGPDEWRFASTLLHETGHVVMATLAGGRRIARRNLSAIPHTTAALTDRGTAFAEGYAIHLETLLGHLSDDGAVTARYRHRRFPFGSHEGFQSEYYRASADFLTFAQSYARYGAVRDNEFAFASAIREGDYLRIQLDPARDHATLRDANQLLQSEGFYASFFFGVLTRGIRPVGEETIRERQRRSLAVLADILPANAGDPDTPWLLRFVVAYLTRYPDETRHAPNAEPDVLDVLLDLSHGVFTDAAAVALWRRHYDAALRLDLERLGRDEIEEARAGWHQSVLEDPAALEGRLGPQLACEIDGATVLLAALGEANPLVFDANTVQEGILRLVPGMTADDAKRWIEARGEAPYVDVADLMARAAPPTRSASAMNCSLDGPAY